MPILSFKAYFRPLSPYPYISTFAPFQAEFTTLQALLQGIWNYLRLNLSAISLRCSSGSCFVGFIFIHATGICAHKLPSWFSATISHSSGRFAASFLMRLLYRPWQKVTAALSSASKSYFLLNLSQHCHKSVFLTAESGLFTAFLRKSYQVFFLDKLLLGSMKTCFDIIPANSPTA